MLDITLNNSRLPSIQTKNIVIDVPDLGSSREELTQRYVLMKHIVDVQNKLIEDAEKDWNGTKNFLTKIGNSIGFFGQEIKLFFTIINYTLPIFSGKHFIPTYWLSILFCWFSTVLEGFFKAAANLCTTLTFMAWEYADTILKVSDRYYKTQTDTMDYHARWERAEPLEKASRIGKVILLFLGWFFGSLGIAPALWCSGQILHLASNILCYTRHLLDATLELLTIFTFPLWWGCNYLLRCCVPSLQPLETADFNFTSALKEIFLNILLLIPASIVMAIVLIPGFGQAAAPALVPLLASVTVGIKSVVLLALFSPPAQLAAGVIHATPQLIKQCGKRCSNNPATVLPSPDSPNAIKLARRPSASSFGSYENSHHRISKIAGRPASIRRPSQQLSPHNAAAVIPSGSGNDDKLRSSPANPPRKRLTQAALMPPRPPIAVTIPVIPESPRPAMPPDLGLNGTAANNFTV